MFVPKLQLTYITIIGTNVHVYKLIYNNFTEKKRNNFIQRLT